MLSQSHPLYFLYDEMNNDITFSNESDDEGTYDVSYAEEENKFSKIFDQINYNESFAVKNTSMYDDVYDLDGSSNSETHTDSDDWQSDILLAEYNKKLKMCHNKQYDEAEDIDSEEIPSEEELLDKSEINKRKEICQQNAHSRIKYNEDNRSNYTESMLNKLDCCESVSLCYVNNSPLVSSACNTSLTNVSLYSKNSCASINTCKQTIKSNDRITVNSSYHLQEFMSNSSVSNKSAMLEDKITVCNNNLQQELLPDHQDFDNIVESEKRVSSHCEFDIGQYRRKSLTDNDELREYSVLHEFANDHHSRRRSNSQEAVSRRSLSNSSTLRRNSRLNPAGGGGKRRRRKNGEQTQKSEDIPGHCGNKNIEELLTYIENRPTRSSTEQSKLNKKTAVKTTNGCLKVKQDLKAKLDVHESNAMLEIESKISNLVHDCKPNASVSTLNLPEKLDGIAANNNFENLNNIDINKIDKSSMEMVKNNALEKNFNDVHKVVGSVDNSVIDTKSTPSRGDSMDIESEVSSIVSSIGDSSILASSKDEINFIKVANNKRKKKSYTNKVSLSMTSQTQHFVYYSMHQTETHRSVTPPPDSFSHRAERFQLPSPSAFPCPPRIRKRSGSEGNVHFDDNELLSPESFSQCFKKSFATIAAENSKLSADKLNLQQGSMKLTNIANAPCLGLNNARQNDCESVDNAKKSNVEKKKCNAAAENVYNSDKYKFIASAQCASVAGSSHQSSSALVSCSSKHKVEIESKPLQVISDVSNMHLSLTSSLSNVSDPTSIQASNFLPTSCIDTDVDKICVSGLSTSDLAVVFLDGKSCVSDLDIMFGFDSTHLPSERSTNEFSDASIRHSQSCKNCHVEYCSNVMLSTIENTVSAADNVTVINNKSLTTITDESLTFNYGQIIHYLQKEWQKAMQRVNNDFSSNLNQV